MIFGEILILIEFFFKRLKIYCGCCSIVLHFFNCFLYVKQEEFVQVKGIKYSVL